MPVLRTKSQTRVSSIVRKTHSLLEVRADVLSKALYIRLQVKSDISLRRIKLADKLPEQLKSVFVPRLGQLVAEQVVELGHQEAV